MTSHAKFAAHKARYAPNTSGFSRRVEITTRESWWTKASAPDQREQFMAAARERQKQKSTDFVAGYANAAGEAEK